jgi:DHA1 family bicyclomycin/chloramphenicol resistance-like MFS transporter
MSRVMSYIMAVFLMVPILAPSIGAALIAVFPWQSVFAFGLVMVAALAIWARVLPETLDPADRRPIDVRAILASTKEVVGNRQTFGYTMAMTMTFAVFSSYLASSERIFGDFYGRADQFPLIFGGLAAVMGAAMLTNANLVERVGAKRITHLSLIGYVAAALVFNLVSLASGGDVSFWAFVLGLAVMVSLHALLIPNFNSIAMLPMGHIAGTASAVIGTVSLAGGALLGALIDRQYQDSAAPLVIAFAVFGILALLWILWAERWQLFAPMERAAQPAIATRSTLR